MNLATSLYEFTSYLVQSWIQEFGARWPPLRWRLLSPVPQHPIPLGADYVLQKHAVLVISEICVNAGVNLQRFSGVRVQHGCKQQGPRYRGPCCFSRFIAAGRRLTAALTLHGYRQSRIYGREGIDLERSTLADWVGKATASSSSSSMSQPPGRWSSISTSTFCRAQRVGTSSPHRENGGPRCPRKTCRDDPRRPRGLTGIKDRIAGQWLFSF